MHNLLSWEVHRPGTLISRLTRESRMLMDFMHCLSPLGYKMELKGNSFKIKNKIEFIICGSQACSEEFILVYRLYAEIKMKNTY